MQNDVSGSHLKPYSVPHEAKQLLIEGVVRNPLFSKDLPAEAEEMASKIAYSGTDAPSIPINWRFAESVSALKGLEAIMVMALLKRKYGVEVKEIAINTFV